MKMNSLVACMAGAFVVAALAPVAQAVTPPFPTIVGPVPSEPPGVGLGPMFPGIRPSLTPGHDLEDFDYVTEEYWISGTACSAAYKTRIVIRRPSDMSKFSGVVVAEPLHRGGNALIMNFSRYGIMQRGHINLEIDARSINLNNANQATQSLQPFNPVRYGPVGNTNVANGFVLANNNNAQANTILAQAGILIKTLTEPTNPLKDWPVQKIVMGGTSDASGAVLTYLSGATGTGCTGSVGHTTLRMPDDGPIYDGFFRGSILNGTPSPVLSDVPHIEMPTQFEVHGSSTAGFRKPDSDSPTNRYRLYEASGASHNDTRDNAGFEPPPVGPSGSLQQTCDGLFLPDGVTRTPFSGDSLSRFDFNATYFLGLQHLIDWTYGIVPPVAPRMDWHSGLTSCTFESFTLSTRVGMDPASFCNAKAGVRSTYLDVPLFSYRIPGTGNGSLCTQTSRQIRFSDSTAVALHLNPRNYKNKWKRRLEQLMAERWVFPEYADEIRADAKVFWDNGPESVFWRNTDGSGEVWYMNAATRASSNPLVGLDNSQTIVGTGDFDGDGQIDILLRKTDGSHAIWLISGGTVGTVAGLPAVDGAWSVAGVGDFDGDGRSDILFRRGSDGANMVWLMNGTSVGTMADLPNAGINKLTSAGAVADFDGDGKADILFRNRDGTNTLWLMDGTTVGAMVPVPTLAAGWTIAGVADFDGDAKADILLRKTSDGSNAVWLMNGASIAASGFLPSLDGSWRIAATADYDGDGKDDVLVRKNDGSNVIWFMNGTVVRSSTPTESFSPSWQAVNK